MLQEETGPRDSWPFQKILPRGRAGGNVCPGFFLLNEELSVNREGGCFLPPSHPFRGKSSLCLCPDRSPPFLVCVCEGGTFFRQIFRAEVIKNKSCLPAVAKQPDAPPPSPGPGTVTAWWEKGCENFPRNIWSGPVSAVETSIPV